MIVFNYYINHYKRFRTIIINQKENYDNSCYKIYVPVNQVVILIDFSKISI